MDKKLKAYVNENCRLLEESGKTFRDIYNISFRVGDLLFAEDNDGFRIRRFSYDDMDKKITAAAGALYDKIGATHGFVALEMENCVDWITAFWAILRSGNKPYLVNCRHTDKLKNDFIHTLDIKYIVSNVTGALEGEYILVSELCGDYSAPDEFEDEIALSTSATSLNEVVCFYSGRSISEQILDEDGILRTNERIANFYNGYLKQLAFLPFYHIFGLVAVYFWFSFFGRAFVFLSDYSSDTIMKTIRKHEVTHIFAVPLFWHTVDKEIHRELDKMDEKTRRKFENGCKLCEKIQNISPKYGANIAKKIMKDVTGRLFGQSVQFCISGGSYLRGDTLRLINALGYPLFNGYGMTEVGITSVELRNTPGERNENSVGRPFSSVEYRINERGTLEIKGSSICDKMMINGEEKPMPEWYDTEDVMECVGGNYFVRGRAGDTVIGEDGENINPDMMEQAFSMPDAVRFSILGLGDEKDPELSMVVQVSRYCPAWRIENMCKTVMAENERLPMSMRVRKFYITYDNISSETAIKVSRKYLTRAIKLGDVTLTDFNEFKAPDTHGAKYDKDGEIAKKVREIVAEAVGADTVDDDAHIIFDLGGTSITYFTIISRLGEEFGLSSYSEKDSYRYTVAEICEYIERHI